MHGVPVWKLLVGPSRGPERMSYAFGTTNVGIGANNGTCVGFETREAKTVQRC